MVPEHRSKVLPQMRTATVDRGRPDQSTNHARPHASSRLRSLCPTIQVLGLLQQKDMGRADTSRHNDKGEEIRMFQSQAVPLDRRQYDIGQETRCDNVDRYVTVCVDRCIDSTSVKDVFKSRNHPFLSQSALKIGFSTSSSC